MELEIRRIHAKPADGEGRRVLVDRLWPRGVSRADLEGVPWVKSVAPSDGLRKWFGHDPAKWTEFKRRYFAELDANPEGVTALRGALVAKGRNTLLFGTREEEHNNAVALCEYLRTHRRR